MSRIAAFPARQGDTFRIQVTLLAGDLPVDLSGYVVEADLYGAAPIHRFAIAQPGVDGVFWLHATPEVTAAWPLGRAACAIRLTAPGGDRTTAPPFAVAIDEEVNK